MNPDVTNIIIADDDQDDQLLMRQAIQDVDGHCSITSVYSGFELLQLLTKSAGDLSAHPDLIVLDINMPMMNGFTALSEIKKTDMLRGIPVFILSTSHSRTDKMLAGELGAAGFYTKPVEFSDLRKIMKEIISGSLKPH